MSQGNPPHRDLGCEQDNKKIGEVLRQKVRHALEELGNGFLSYLRSNPGDLEAWCTGKLATSSGEEFLTSSQFLTSLYHESVSLIYRLLFLFYAESRNLLPMEDEVYRHSYSLESIRDNLLSAPAATDPKQFFGRESTPLWGRLKELFDFVGRGGKNAVPVYDNGLFDPTLHEFLEHFKVGDSSLARVICLLGYTRSLSGRGEGRGYKKIDYRHLHISHLGNLYESILEYSPRVADRDLAVIRRGPGNKIYEEYVPVSELIEGEKYCFRALRRMTEGNLKLRRGSKVVGFRGKGRYFLAYSGDRSRRKSSSSYYTPDYIIRYIVENTLGPSIRGQSSGGNLKPISLTSDAILKLKVLYLVMGSGHFLMGAIEYLAHAYREALIQEGKVAGDDTFVTYRRIITEHCIYGMDIDPMAVELARLSLWLFAADRNRPLSFLNSRLKCINALILRHIEEASPRRWESSPAPPFFYWEQEFPEVWLSPTGESLANPGFSAIVMNPPYLGFKAARKSDRPLWSAQYPEIFDGKGDVYYLFLAQAVRALQRGGRLGAITPRYWLESETATALRKYVDAHIPSQRFLDFSEFPVFKGVGARYLISFLGYGPAESTCFVLRGARRATESEMRACLRSGDLSRLFSLREFKQTWHGRWRFLTPSHLSWIEALQAQCVRLDTLGETKQGIVTGCDRAFIATDKVFCDWGAEPDLLRPWLKIGDILPFIHRRREPPLRLLYANHLDTLKVYPGAEAFVSRYRPRLETRRECKKGLIPYFHLQWGRARNLFEAPKLIARKIAPLNCFIADVQGYYSGADTTLFLPETRQPGALYFLLGFLNSRLATAYYHTFAKRMDSRFEYGPTSVGQMLVPDPSPYASLWADDAWNPSRQACLDYPAVLELPAPVRISTLSVQLSHCKYASPEYEMRLKALNEAVHELLNIPEKWLDPGMARNFDYRWKV